MAISKTVIISCAGMGNRLGLGTTKALVEVCGKPLIIRHLEQLDAVSDVRIVVGYQAEKVIEVVNCYRKDILYVFNHNFKHTGTGASLSLGAQFANDYILSLDGDLLIHPDDMKKILSADDEFVSGGNIETDDPWMLKTEFINGTEFVTGFSHEQGKYEWNGISQLKSERAKLCEGHVYQMIEPSLPLPFLNLRTKEIDTINDYERAVSWVRNGYQ